jgi:hypothetical protein
MHPGLEGELTDDALLAAFESTDLPADLFTHAAHVRVAWCYLRTAPLLDALPRFSRALRRYTASKGAAAKYHETITIAWLLIVRDRLEGARHLTWREFVERNPDLVGGSGSVLAAHYSDALLTSAAARERFVLPDRQE